MKNVLFSLLFIISVYLSHAQDIKRFNPDTIRSIVIDSAVNIRSHKLTAQDFIDAVVADTGFYKAFQNMKKYSFIAENHLYIYDKKNRVEGKIYRKIKRTAGQAEKVQYLAKSDSGKIYKKNGKYDLYTVEMFDYVFEGAYKKDFAKSEPAAGSEGKNESYKDKLKTLIFEPGRKIRGIPFISGKTEIFGPDLRQFYNYEFARGKYLDSIPVYRFKVIQKPSSAPDDVMIRELTTIFDMRTFEILGRYVDMHYSNLLFSFNVKMNIELNKFNGELLPVKVSYQGNWDVPFHKEERVSFLITQRNYK
jgi:hypothetical protein